MNDPSWLISLLLAIGFLLAAGMSSGGLVIGWLVLSAATFVVAAVRFSARRRD